MNFIVERIEELEELSALKESLIEDLDFMPELSAEERLYHIMEINESEKLLYGELDELLFESDNYFGLELLQEVNIRRLDKKTQRQMRKIMVSIQLAKAANDPLYTRYKKGVDLRKKAKMAILNKYGGKAMSIVMQEKDGE